MLCDAWFMFYVFFFKQKTAYEMRISDWSSDVCSSDLDRGSPGPPRQLRPDARGQVAAPQRRGGHDREPPRSVRRLWCVPVSTASAFLDSVAGHQAVQIGRPGYPAELRRHDLDLLAEVCNVARDLNDSHDSYQKNT